MIEELYKEHHDRLVCWCSAMTRDRELAEDIVQETFIRAMAILDKLEELSTSQVRSWLCRTARNLFIDSVRRSARFADREPAEEPTADDLSAPYISAMCMRLPEEERALFVLRYFEGYNSRELGELFDLPPSTVRARLLSARARMKKFYFEE